MEQIKKAAMAAHGQGEGKKSDGAAKQEGGKKSEGQQEEELDEVDLKYKGEGKYVCGEEVYVGGKGRGQGGGKKGEGQEEELY